MAAQGERHRARIPAGGHWSWALAVKTAAGLDAMVEDTQHGLVPSGPIAACGSAADEEASCS